jgi:hypothetical protein
MGSIACYKPRPGCEEALLELVRNHPAATRPRSRNGFKSAEGILLMAEGLAIVTRAN